MNDGRLKEGSDDIGLNNAISGGGGGGSIYGERASYPRAYRSRR